jgi:hypothetical protein
MLNVSEHKERPQTWFELIFNTGVPIDFEGRILRILEFH